MTANPISNRLAKQERQGAVTTEMLHDYVEQINQRHFVKASGQFYFVNRRMNDDGTATHFLDRHL